MASPIAGVLFLGLFSGGPNAGMPAHHLVADNLPTPQCVVCGPANRATTRAAAEAFQLSANLRQRRDVARRLSDAGDEILGADRMGITEERLQRILSYAGV